MSDTLRRIDPARNMQRFYSLDVQPDLFGAFTLVREWGRIGRGGRVKLEGFPSADEAHGALERQRHIKERRGYSVADPT